MSYRDLITQEAEFTYSANIQFDIENDHKLLRFIPNETTTAIIKEYFTDITRYSPEHHARILYGSYGTGKSHLLTVLSLLFSKTYTDGFAFSAFIEKLRHVDEALAADIEAFIQNPAQKPFLVVPIVFDFEDFDRCIYFSLKRKLESLHISVEFKTFYDQAAQLVAQWRSTEESETRLKEACRKVGIKLASLEKMLARYDKQAEHRFQKLFSEMTYGVPFVYEISNLSEAVEQASKAVADNYSGIIFIFDEFGRYIEDNIKNIKVKSVQDLAEVCDHGEGNNHIILVSHKEISQYTQRYGKSISNEWKKVEGRYKATPITDKQDQSLSLVSSVLTKNPELWPAFRQHFITELNNMYSEAADFRGFLVSATAADNPYEGGFPLHPIALYALDRLSKKVAQNERTFFTYLASHEESSLFRFLESHELNEFHFVGIDDIYDYFEPSIKAVQSDSSFEWYRNLQRALAKCNLTDYDNTAETRILKVIATIGIINDASTLNADKSTILKVIDLPDDQLSDTLTMLCERKILKYSRAYNRYEFFEASIFDIEELIAEGSRRVENKSLVTTLNESFLDFVLYPHRYNREYKIKRIFIPTYCLPEDLSKKSFTSQFGSQYDGILALLVADENTNIEEIVSSSQTLERVIVVVRKDTDQIKIALRQYMAVSYLETTKEEYVSRDPAFEKEIQYYKEEITAVIRELLGEWKRNYADAVVISEGRVLPYVVGIEDLSDVASDLLTESFSQTLIVNNELINKNSVSGSIMTAKRNVLNGIIAGEAPEDYYGVQYLSPDYIAIRSVLVKNGFIDFNDDTTTVVQNALPSGDRPQDALRIIMNSAIQEAMNGPVSFGDIYSELKSSPYGLRDGYLSLIFAHFLRPHKSSLIILSHGAEQEVTAELYEEIVRRPKDYSFTIATWSKEELDYFDSLSQLFFKYINQTAYGKNRIKAIYDAMLTHYKGVSKYARTTEKHISASSVIYRHLMARSATSYSDFLLHDLGEIAKDLDERINVINAIKIELETLLQNVARDLAEQINSIFGSTISTPLGQLLSEKYQSEWSQKRQKSFDYYTNVFLDFCSKLSSDISDYQVVCDLSKVLTGLELDYWSDKHYADLLERLSEIKAVLDAYQSSGGLSDAEMRITLVTSKGQEKSIVFDKNELSNLGKTVKIKINSTFGNYGLAISYNEKVQIVLSVLEDLMEGK